ncbi:MAG: hypothetical protein RIC29_07110 [Rhodospirillaceae bacterium]
MRILNIFSVVFMLSILSPTAHASCVTIALLDEAGSVIKPNGLVTAVKVGETPIFVQELPTHTEQREVGVVGCPPEVIRPVQDIYNGSCINDEALQLTATNNGTTLKAVRERCNALAEAISTAQLVR